MVGALGVVVFIIFVLFLIRARNSKRSVKLNREVTRQQQRHKLTVTKAELTVKLAKADKALEATWSTLLKGGESQKQ